jgi:alpha-N-arabinofuranosidase
MRDALVAGLTLNYLNERCDRVKMANIAQTVNVLQALIFTEEEKMLLTPTYYIYEMYKVHQDAVLLPLEMDSPHYSLGSLSLPSVQASASRDKDGKIHISIVNIDPVNARETFIRLIGSKAGELSATILSSAEMNSHNTFENPREVVLKEFEGVNSKGDRVTLVIPPHSVIMLEIN